MQDFREIKAWQKAHQLTLDVYLVTQHFPREEVYGLTSQLRRACVSIGSNIGEGSGRGTLPNFIQFCQNAFASLCEVEYQLLLARDLKYLSEASHAELETQVVEIKRMLASFLSTLRERAGKPRTKGFIPYSTETLRH
jgi:four helix bundle protein